MYLMMASSSKVFMMSSCPSSDLDVFSTISFDDAIFRFKINSVYWEPFLCNLQWINHVKFVFFRDSKVRDDLVLIHSRHYKCYVSYSILPLFKVSHVEMAFGIAPSRKISTPTAVPVTQHGAAHDRDSPPESNSWGAHSRVH